MAADPGRGDPGRIGVSPGAPVTRGPPTPILDRPEPLGFALMRARSRLSERPGD